MIISSASDYREAARRRVPPFMFHYADGGSYAEQTLARNVSDLENIALRQRVLKDMVCRLLFQQCQFVQLKKSPLRLSVQCGFSFMC